MATDDEPSAPPPLPRCAEMIEAGIAAGLHTGAQLYVSLGGETVASLAFGQARPGVAMTPRTLMLWMSSTKPVGAVAIAQLWERGLLELDDRVTRFVPEFGQGGKDAITLRHVLTHTGGFRAGPRWADVPWEQTIAEICASRIEPGWVPGRCAGYHPGTSWFILGEVVRRIDGRPFDRVVREDIFEPLGMVDSWVGIPEARYEAYGRERIAPLYEVGPGGEVTPPMPEALRAAATLVRPGASGWGPLSELGRFYEMLLNRGALGGTRIIRPQTVEALTARHRVGMLDQTFKQPIDWGLGFLINSNAPGEDGMPYGFGPDASPRTFGHGGVQSSAGFCDPERKLVVAYAFNGMPGEVRHHERRAKITRAIYEDLGLR